LIYIIFEYQSIGIKFYLFEFIKFFSIVAFELRKASLYQVLHSSVLTVVVLIVVMVVVKVGVVDESVDED
jgi:hypothetical protein